MAVAEANGEERTRTFCLAMNAPEDSDDGGPSSLSCELDALAVDPSQPRLFCVAAGNLEGALRHTDYQSLNETTSMLSPSQAWNALALAACTRSRGSQPSSHARATRALSSSTSNRWTAARTSPLRPRTTTATSPRRRWTFDPHAARLQARSTAYASSRVDGSLSDLTKALCSTPPG